MFRNGINKELNSGTPSNISVSNCNFDVIEEPNCNSDSMKSLNNVFLINKQPQYDSGYVDINKILTNANDFYPVKCGKNQNGYGSSDPRLINQERGTTLVLDKPPLDTGISIEDIYNDPSLEEYGKKYNSYDDIKSGQITYYTDKSIDNAYYTPNFVTQREVEGSLDKDPMGGIAPRYKRDPGYRDPFTRDNNFEYCLSWMEDSMAQRQDIMSRQMSRINKQRWSPRWDSN
jgi:hypothetical protein